ncbi:MAG TPA: ABC transporter ATP-binding protein [Terriglobales bacterium]|nr:ABC transporter ATP-binding protein [Terriglobales bacterium]
MSEAIRIEQMTKSYSTWRRSFVAVRELDLTVPTGSVVAFIGPNGAGKTTTIYSLLGLLSPDRGRVTIFGDAAGSVAARQHIGFLPEIFYTYPYRTARQAMQLYGQLSGLSREMIDARLPAVLARVGLSEAVDRKVGTFSKGMVQRLGLAQAIVHQPRLLILDEPTTGLDPEGRRTVVDLILQEKARGATIFLSSHILSDVERTCDRVIMIQRGRMVASTALAELAASTGQWIVEITRWQAGLASRFAEAGYTPAQIDGDTAAVPCNEERKEALLRLALELGLGIGSIRQSRRSLEEMYMELIQDAPKRRGPS